ncbi:hypothetical protein FACS189459_5980 [Bacilli bacterium]|nr:hypothetical protein FACS189459_5980 [Bacilli bacterium]
MAVVKFKERKIKKQQKIASISPELKANYQVMIDVFADLDSQTILNSINKPDGTPEMAHMIKSMRSLAKRKERIEAVAAKYPFFNELCNRLIIIKTPSTLK